MAWCPKRKGARDRTSPARVARTTLEAECLRLRAKGYSFLEISEVLGISARDPAGKVEYLIRAALERKGKPEAETVRGDLYDRLDRAYNRAMRIAMSDSPDRVAALNAATGISARMAALIGADSPKQLEATVDNRHRLAPASLASFVEELAEEAGEEGPAEG